MTKENLGGATVLVVDGGGRGSALVHAYAQSSEVSRIIAVPGNDGMKLTQKDTGKPVDIHIKLKTTNVEEILEICREEKVNLVDVAQDNAVEIGLVDELEKRGISVVGPTRAAGQIEWDKAWARKFGTKYGLPQPDYQVFSSKSAGINYIRTQPEAPRFAKAAYLAGGKGSLSAKTNTDAVRRIKELKKFSKAAKVYLIEEWLRGENDEPGEEFSSFIFTDGKNIKIAGHAQDHKSIDNFNELEMTGGMGCSSPPLVLTPDLVREVEQDILEKAIQGMSSEERTYKGVLYLGGMIVKREGRQKPYVIEFNARWGDPEAQVILPGLLNDLFEVSVAIAQGDISKMDIRTDQKVRIAIAGVSRGYPEDYSRAANKRIYGIDDVRRLADVKLYTAGIKEENDKYYTNGGRLFYVVAEGKNLIEARQRGYEAMSMMSVEDNNLNYRFNIGWPDVERLRQSQ